MRVVRTAAVRPTLLVSAAVMAIMIAVAACGGGKHGPTSIDGLKIDETINLTGLDGPVDVVRDEYGRPHVYATDLHDLAKVTGWLHTEDRFIQMDLQRRIASGRLAELVGVALPTAIDLDRQFHAYGLHRAAKKIYDSLPAGSDAKIAMDAYAEGVNAKLATFTAPPSPEYTVFQYPFAQTPPWTPVDSLTVGRLLAFQLDWDGDVEIAFADELAKATAVFTTGAHAGFVADTLLNFKPAEPITIVNPPASFAAAPVGRPSAALPRASLAAARALRERLNANPISKIAFPEKGFGSNDWVVGGTKTASGHPMVCNDPHLSLSAPPVWYELHWSTVRSGGDIDITGVSFPGVPAIILGGNGNVGWGVTNVGPDATDTYIEHYSIATGSTGADQVLWDDDGPSGAHAPAYIDLVKDTAAILVRSSATATTTVIDTIWLTPQRNGVIVPGSLVVNTAQSAVTGTALSWSWTGFSATNEFKTFFALMRAKNAAEVVAADLQFDTPPQNMVYADVEGNIGYIGGGWYPIRGDDDGDLHTDPPFLPMPGYDGAHEWIGRLSDAQVPQETNPARGWLASANQDPIGTSADGDVLNDAVYLGALNWDIGFRGARIARVLTNLSNIKVGEMTILQADHHSNFGERMTPFLIDSIVMSHPVQAQMLQAWGDRGYLAPSGVGDNLSPNEIDDSAATSLFNAWVTSMRVAAFQDEELYGDVGLDQFQAASTLLLLLERPMQAATFDSTTGESALWDDVRTPQIESRDNLFKAAMDDALTFLASPAGFSSTDSTDWRWGLLHTVNFARQSGLSPLDIPAGTDPDFPKGYPRHSDLFNVDVGNFGLADKNFTYGAGASMREVIDLTPGRMRMFNQLPGGASADPQSPHYADRAEEYSKNLSRESWYRERDVAGHGKSRVQFVP